MITKTIFKVKSPFSFVFFRFSSQQNLDVEEIEDIISDLNVQKLSLAFDEKGRYYVNKMNGLCQLMKDLQCVSIFRPRRMGKTTMLEDLSFLYNTGMLFDFLEFYELNF